MIESVLVVWLVSRSWIDVRVNVSVLLRSCEHPQRLYNERGMSADTGAVCAHIQSCIVEMHPHFPP